FCNHPPSPDTSLVPYTTLFRSYPSGVPVLTRAALKISIDLLPRHGSAATHEIPPGRGASDRVPDGAPPGHGDDEHEEDHELHDRSEEHTSELQSRENLVCRLLL